MWVLIGAGAYQQEQGARAPTSAGFRRAHRGPREAGGEATSDRRWQGAAVAVLNHTRARKQVSGSVGPGGAGGDRRPERRRRWRGRCRREGLTWSKGSGGDRTRVEGDLRLPSCSQVTARASGGGGVQECRWWPGDVVGGPRGCPGVANEGGVVRMRSSGELCQIPTQAGCRVICRRCSARRTVASVGEVRRGSGEMAGSQPWGWDGLQGSGRGKGERCW